MPGVTEQSPFAFFDRLAEIGGLDWRQTQAHVHGKLAAFAQKMEIDPPKLAKIDDIILDGAAGPLRARFYQPSLPSRPRPAIVFFHGGGFVTGSLDSHDSLCRRLASHSDCALISVDYRLAPEFPFPAAFDDARSAFLWVVARAKLLAIDPDRIAVAGDSTGGNLAAAISLDLMTYEGPSPALQVLFYPLLRFDAASAAPGEPLHYFVLTTRALDFFKRAYLASDIAGTDPRISPLHAPDLRGLPPAFIVSAGLDPLRTEAIDYAERLRSASVPVVFRDYPSQFHSFLNWTSLSLTAIDALRDAGEHIGVALGKLTASSEA